MSWRHILLLQGFIWWQYLRELIPFFDLKPHNVKQNEAPSASAGSTNKGACMYLAFTRMPGESYSRRLRSLLSCLRYVFRALINSLVCWFKPHMYKQTCVQHGTLKTNYSRLLQHLMSVYVMLYLVVETEEKIETVLTGYNYWPLTHVWPIPSV